MVTQEADPVSEAGAGQASPRRGGTYAWRLVLTTAGSVLGAIVPGVVGGGPAATLVGTILAGLISAFLAGEKPLDRTKAIVALLLTAGAAILTVSGFTLADFSHGRSVLHDSAYTFPVASVKPEGPVASPPPSSSDAPSPSPVAIPTPVPSQLPAQALPTPTPIAATPLPTASPPPTPAPSPSPSPIPSTEHIRRHGTLVLEPGQVADLDSMASDWGVQRAPGGAENDIWINVHDASLHGANKGDIAVLPAGSSGTLTECALEHNYGVALTAANIRPGKLICDITGDNRVALLRITAVQYNAGTPAQVTFDVSVRVEPHQS